MTTDADTRPRSTRLPRSERRVQLLESALEVFVAAGYHAASMDDIAGCAGVSKPVLYQHFPGKLELYLALLDRACDHIIEAVHEALTGPSTSKNHRASTGPTSTKTRVVATTAAFYACVADTSGAFRLVFESDLTNEPAVRARVDRVTLECADVIAEAIADDTGLGDESAQLLAVALTGMSQVSARFWVSTHGAIPQHKATELVSRLAWRGVHGLPRHT